jgi:hypothetical protein
MGAQIDVRNTETGTVTNLFGLRIRTAGTTGGGGGGTVVNMVGIQVNAQTLGNNNYGIISQVTSGTNNFNLYVSGSAKNYFAGNVGIGQSSPTALLHLKAGTATANTAPLKLTAGTNLTTPENGAIEFDGTNIYITVGGVRKTFTIV